MPPKKELYTHIMYCDYGHPEQAAREIRRSYSEESAKNSWEKLYKSFSHTNWRCWQEDREGKIIRDTDNASSVH